MSQALPIQKDQKEKTKGASRLQAEILLSGGASMGSYVTEGEDRFIIGSSKRADLVLPHADISQIHAMLRLSGEDILLYDLGSDSGTFVGGKKIVERKLNSGDSFEIGGHQVRVNLVEGINEKYAEQAVFWESNCDFGPNNPVERLEVLSFNQGLLRDERTVLSGARLRFGRGRKELPLSGVEFGEIFLQRKDSGEGHRVEGVLPAGFVAEVYNGENNLLRTTEGVGAKFEIHDREKVRLISPDQKREILILWQAQGLRVSRNSKDAESPMLKKALGTCLAVALLFLTVFSYVPLKKEVIEEATIPKSSYERVSMSSSPAPAQAEASAQSDQSASKQTEQKQDSTVASISSTLSKMLNKKSSVTAENIKEAISTNGTQTSRDNNLKSANVKSQEIASGAVGGGSVNVNALSAGLSNGSGAKAGSLKGFAGGKGATVGAGSGFSKGFDLSLGGEEAEALGGLDKSLIAAVVQANIGQIKHCYERQLIVDPNIYGKVVASWTINKEGLVSVSSVKKTTMNNKAVENCITAKIKNWNFPKPKGGGQVLVSYPFLFKALN